MPTRGQSGILWKTWAWKQEFVYHSPRTWVFMVPPNPLTPMSISPLTICVTGERIGLVAFVTRDSSLTQNVVTVLERVQRATVSTPPLYGAKLVSTILGTSEIKSQWEKDIITMSSRILAVRQKLHQRLLELQTPGDWSHIIAQEGMFSYLGLSPTQVAHIRGEE